MNIDLSLYKYFSFLKFGDLKFINLMVFVYYMSIKVI